MKKAYILPIVLFVVFFVADIALIAIIENTNGTMYFFLAAIFLEIAIYGSVILNEVMKYNEKKAEKKDEKQDEQITGNSDKK